MSASSTASTICIFARSSAMVNSSGACRLAATVWPGSMLRVSTTPSTGERITVRSRLTCVVCGRGGLLADLRLRGVDLRARLVERGAGQVDVAARDQLPRAEVGLALVVELGVEQRRPAPATASRGALATCALPCAICAS